MSKTNNFDQLPKTEELWIIIDNWKLKVYYKDDKWWESISRIDSKIDYFQETEEDMENIYLSHCISVYEIYSKCMSESVYTSKCTLMAHGTYCDLKPYWRDVGRNKEVTNVQEDCNDGIKGFAIGRSFTFVIWNIRSFN